MAERSTQDVVKQAQSVGDQSSIDVSGTNTSTSAAVEAGGPGSRVEDQQNAFDSGKHASNGEQATLSSNITTSEHANVNGIDSASYNGSEDNGYQRSIDGESQKNEGQGLDAGNWRQRSNSTTKRATSFKPVSVTKNYLAKTTSPSPALGKSATDRGQPGIQPSSGSGSGPRPRLVAKLGKDKLTASVASPPSGGPDASKVWNRNRPATHAPQKQFTDEELKQQYGIHMATRLQADEATKDGKWADIDDDEDDWAPETVQWMDGTKSTLLPEKTPPPPAKAQAPPPPPKSDEGTEKKPPTPAQLTPTIQSTGKTILRPGARNNVQMRPGLALKSVPEAPSAPVKSTPSGSQSKSPWASLPPVDKASPVTFNPPQPPSVQAALRRDSSAIDDLPTPSPAREMAADDFDRSWRTDEKGGQTLFNSQSGRYEPVRGVRRGSRHDPNFRPPSVLQRPSQGQADMFHNRETQPGPRRRDSSFDNRRLPVPDQPDTSKPPQAVAPAILPVDGQHQNVTSADFEQQQQQQQQPTQPASDEDIRAEQQRLMRERIELNRKRKLEEQDREEAEKRERIRLKLAALAPPEKKEPAKTAQQEIESAQPPAAPETAALDNTTAIGSQQQPPIDRQSPHISPQKPFANTSSPTRFDRSRLSPPKPSSFDQQPSQRASNHSSSSQPTPPTQVSTPAHPLVKSTSDSNALANRSPELTELPGLGQPPTQQRQPHHNNQYPRSSWNNNRHAPMAATSVWGPPASDRPIGNGAFNGDMTRMPPAQNSSLQHAQHRPNAMAQVVFPPSNLTSSPPGPNHQAADENAAGMQQAFQRRPGFAPQGYRRGGPEQAVRQPATGINAWNQFKDNVDAHDAGLDDERLRKADEEFKRLLAARAAGGEIRSGPQFRDKYVKTSVKDDDLAPGAPGKRRVVETGKSIFDSVSSPGDAGSGQAPQLADAPQQAPLQPVPNGRHSRFFGQGPPSMPPAPISRPIGHHLALARSDSPPPPETGSLDRVEVTPKVNLPKNKPTVKLPPLSQAPAPMSTTNVIMPTNKPGSNNLPSDWQQRIKDLLFKHPNNAQSQTVVSQPPVLNPPPAAPAQHSAAPIDSSSKTELLGSPTSSAATVSMPVQPAVSIKRGTTPTKLELSPDTKPASDGLVDEREHGSKPPMKTPKGMHPRSDQILSPLPHLKPQSGKEESRNAFATTKPSELKIVFEPKTNKVTIDMSFDSTQKVVYMSKSSSNARSKNNRNTKRNASGKGPASAGDTSASVANDKPMVNGVSASKDNVSSPALSNSKQTKFSRPEKANPSNGEPSHAPAKESRWAKKSDMKAPRGPRGPRAVTAQQ